MSEWKKVRLGEVADVKGGKRLPAGMMLTEEQTNHPYIRIRDLTDVKNLEITTAFQYVTDDVQQRISRYIVDEGDVLISIVGTVGLVSIVGRSLTGANLTENCVKIINLRGLDNNYLYYYLKSASGQYQIRNLTVGAVQPKLPITNILSIQLSLPPLPTQRRIAAVLSSLDDKIENNRKICANLEAQAQAIFKSWFVDFEPFGGKMPQGWKMGKISSVFQLARDSVKAGERPDLPYLPIDMLPMHSFFVNSYLPNEDAQSSLILFKKWDVLIGAMRVYFHRVLPAPCDGITRTTCFVLRAIKDCYREFGLMAINQDEAITFAQQTSKGSTMPYAVWEGGLADYETVIPDEKAAENFSRLLRNLIEEEQSLAKESRSLAALRDALLPKLMNGEIDVEKVKVA